MLKKTVTYEDFDGNERTEDFYFNLTKTELLDLRLLNYDSKINKMVNAKDVPEILGSVKDILLKAYGEKSDDGRHFIKVRNGVKLAEEFEQTEAFSQIYLELLGDENASKAFMEGIIPKDLRNQVQVELSKRLDADKN